MNKLILLLCLVSAVVGKEKVTVGGTKGGSIKGSSVKGSSVVHPSVSEYTPDVSVNEKYFDHIRVEDRINFPDHIDDYIKYNRYRYKHTLEEYRKKLKEFKQDNAERLGGIKLQLASVSRRLVQMEEYLNPLEILSDFHKDCVAKHRSSIIDSSVVKHDFDECLKRVENENSPLLNEALNTENDLESFYSSPFEPNIESCRSNAKYLPNENYTECVLYVVADSNRFTAENKKRFEQYLDTAKCTAKANIKKALFCTYEAHIRTIKSISEAKELIESCLSDTNECPPCEADTCSVGYTVTPDLESDTMQNPFLHQRNTNCVVLMAEYNKTL